MLASSGMILSRTRSVYCQQIIEISYKNSDFFFPYEVPAHGASAICLEEHSAFDRHGQCCVKLPKTAGESTLV